MHCLAGLDTVSAGQVWLGDTEITGLKDRELTRLRRDRIGFMFQSFNLIPTLNAAENITLPMDIAGQKPDQKWLDQVIDTLGLRDRLKHRPSQLSGGQQQRVACARALASRPELIFADEPTGNLDSRAGLEVLGFLREAVDTLGQTVVMVTHDPSAAAHSDLVLFLGDGRIVDEIERPTADAVLERLRRSTGGQGRRQTSGADAVPVPLDDGDGASAESPDGSSGAVTAEGDVRRIASDGDTRHATTDTGHVTSDPDTHPDAGHASADGDARHTTTTDPDTDPDPDAGRASADGDSRDVTLDKD
jgi:putative ABC transport system ATP-binding protein